MNAADVLVLMVSDRLAIEETLLVFSSSDESKRRLHLRGKTVLQMGTIGPDDSRTVAQRVEAMGGVYVEAPVLGSQVRVCGCGCGCGCGLGLGNV